MVSLNADESRVLGVLIEKSTTTPEQYPLSLNAIVNGSNQKNNRDPVRTMTEDQCFDALESLREKGMVVRVDTPGSRVHKYRHNAGDVLHARTGELAILAELLMRGPQTVGELRGRAMLEGARGQPPCDLDALAEALSKLSIFAAAKRAEFTSIDINPLLVRPRGQGAAALDALILTPDTVPGDDEVAP